MEHTANHILLRGTLASLPQFSHENHGRRFSRFFLEVPRLSGAVDTLPVIVEETLLHSADESRNPGGTNLQRTHLPKNTAGQGNLRCDAGSSPGIQASRLPPLHFMGKNRSGNLPLSHTGLYPYLRTYAKQNLHQAHRRSL